MNETSIKPYDWVKQIPASLMELDEKPLFGYSPPFPWESLSAAIAKLFEQKDVVIRPGDMQWRSADELLKGLGAKPLLTSVELTGLEGTFTWAMAKADMESCMQKLLSLPSASLMALDKDFGQGFYQFALSQVLQILKQLNFDKNLSATLMDSPQELAHEPAFCLDILLSVQQQNFQGRLIISQALRHSWKERYAERKLGSLFQHSLAQKASVTIHLEAGRTQLSPSELKALRVGDYVILDSCSYEPDTDKGRVLMTTNGVVLFRAKLKDGQLKILEFPFHQEEQPPMSTKEHDEEFEESEIEDLSEEFLDEDEPTELSELEEEKEEPEAEQKSSSTPQASSKPVGEGKVAIQDLPVNVIIEVGRIQISVQKLMELTPGNLLELNISPENGVDLVVNGKRIGKGELIRIGETLGLRVLDLG